MTETLAADLQPTTTTTAPPADPDYRHSFFRWGVGAYLLCTAVLFAISWFQSGHRLVYLIDDPAIHLSIAENLVHHGTWGVVPGHFQSASSSPVWTLLLSGYITLATGVRHLGIPLKDTAGPLLLNLAAGIWVINIVAGQQRVLLPNLRRPLDCLAVVALVVGVLFLPALSLLGMEHTLQIALVLSIVILVHRRVQGVPLGWPRWTPYALLAVATLVRFETLFVAAGVCVAVIAAAVPGWSEREDPAPLGGQIRLAVGLGLSALIPFLLFVFFNHVVMGQGYLPNSVLAKGQGINGHGGAFAPTQILNRFTTDPLLAALTAVAVAAVMVGWRQRRRYTFIAIVLIVAVAGQVTFAQIGWFERYQAYLVALGVLLLLAMADELVPQLRRPPARAFLVPGLALLMLTLCVTKISLTVQVPTAVQDTYQQRYQAARFLAQYYDGQPVATGELGYISLEHKGPVTDLFGLGDYQVLQARRAAGQVPPMAYWDQLAKERGFKVVAVYPSTLLFNAPHDWIHVGDWHMNHRTVTALEQTFQFWVTSPQRVKPLEAQLRSFQSSMPAGSTLTVDPLAEYRAALLSKH
jgi:hypothetical protein